MPVASRTFRVFVSSTFDDLVEERNALQRDVFPTVRQLCEVHGARFQAIDLRWGVRNEAVVGQKMMENCLAEIDRCQRTGIKPNFIVLLGDRYGAPPVPARIVAEEYEAVFARVDSAADRAVIERWYQRDNNAIPAEYLLRSRTGPLVGVTQWREIEAPLGAALRKAARAAGLAPDALLKYVGSATHQEIMKGLGGTAEDRQYTFAFLRSARDASNEPAELRELKDFVRAQLGGNALTYEAGDIAGLCKMVSASLSRVIASETSRFDLRAATDVEVDAHDLFATKLRYRFTGRAPVLEAISDYLENPAHRPLLVLGPSGSGKSAVIAKASEDHPGISRFIGATPESSSGLTLLRSLCRQIGERFGLTGDPPTSFNELVGVFQERVQLANADRPLVLYLDALDQFGAHEPAVTMDWLPNELPSHCHVVLSASKVPATLADAQLLHIGPLSDREAREMLDLWLLDSKRTLLHDQRDKVLAGVDSPLYLKLAFEEARTWRSFDPLDECVLGEGLTGITERLIARLSAPANHGAVLVRHALGLLATARFGLTEDEMLDLLAANDEVWRDFEGARKHDLPEGVRALPAIIWSRLYLDLEPYLTERAVPGGTTISFYSRQLAERLEQDESTHAELAASFDRSRKALDQYSWSTRWVRGLSELPFHLFHSGQLLRWHDMLLTLAFLQAKLDALGVFAVLEDFATPRAETTLLSAEKWQALDAVHRALRASAYALQLDRDELPAQLLGRLSDDAATPGHTLVSAAQSYARRIWLRPAKPCLTSAASRLQTTCVGHTQAATHVMFTVDGSAVVSASLDGTIRMWSVNSGEELRQVSHSKSDETQGAKGHAASSSSASAVVTCDKSAKGLALFGGRWCLLQHPGSLRMTPLSYGDTASAVALSRDGALAVFAEANRITVLGLEDGRRVAEWTAANCEWVHQVAISPDKESVVLAVGRSPRGTSRESEHRTGIIQMRLSSGEELQSFLIPAFGTRAWFQKELYAEIRTVAWTSDGKRLVAVSADGILKVWSSENGTEVLSLDVRVNDRVCTAISADYGDIYSHASAVVVLLNGDADIVLAIDNRLYVWNLQTGRMIREIGVHTGAVTSLCVAPDEMRLASGADDRTVRLWSLARLRDETAFVVDKSEVTKIALGAGGVTAMACTASGRVKRFDAKTGLETRDFGRHHDKIEVLRIQPSGKLALSASAHEFIVWNQEDGRQVHSWNPDLSVCSSFAMSTNWKWAASTGQVPAGNGVILWDFTKMESHAMLGGHWDSVAGVSDDGQTIILQSHSGATVNAVVMHERVRDGFDGRTTYIWRTLEEKQRIDGFGMTLISISRDLERGYFGVHPNYSGEGAVVIMSLLDATETGRLPTQHGYVTTVVEGSDRNNVICALSDGDLVLWAVKQGVNWRLSGHAGPIRSISVDRAWKVAASGGQDGFVILWDLICQRAIARFRSESEIVSCELSDDGQRLVAVDRSGHALFLEVVRPRE